MLTPINNEAKSTMMPETIKLARITVDQNQPCYHLRADSYIYYVARQKPKADWEDFQIR